MFVINQINKFSTGSKKHLLYYFSKICFCNINGLKLNNYKTLKSNKQAKLQTPPHLKLCAEKTNSVTYVFARVLKNCLRPSIYLIYNRCFCQFTYNLARSVKGMLRRNIEHFLKSRIYIKLGFSE